MAQSIGPLDFDADFAPADEQMRSRAEAFTRAERHSRRVQFLKIVLPVAALCLAGGLAAYSIMAKPVQTAASPDDSAIAEGKLVMDSPKLEGFTRDGRPYLVTATRAIQDVASQDVINLDGIDAKMPIEKENWAHVVATSGTYDRSANTLDVPTDILLTTTDGLVAKFKSAFMDINGGTLKSDAPVDIQSRGSRVTADSMSVHDNGKLVVFETSVRVHIDPVQTKAAQAERGGADASN